tara:strand:- start:649 stop:753 length:105 start_codon:yes stop_codon:yes gene_type:complete
MSQPIEVLLRTQMLLIFGLELEVLPLMQAAQAIK